MKKNTGGFWVSRSFVTLAWIKANLALGYVRRQVHQIGPELRLQTVVGESGARIVDLPFTPA